MMSPNVQPGHDLARLDDVPITVEARIGSRSISVKDILTLRPNTVLSLEKPAGETLDVIVGNVRLGSAEVVVMDDRLALRITDFDLALGVPLPSQGVGN